jgi:hypothetical protein
MGIRPRFDCIICFLTLKAEGDENRFGPIVKEANALLQRSYAISEARNRIVHDPWFIDKSDSKDSGVVQLMSMPRNDRRYGIVQKDNEWLNETITKISAFTSSVKEFDRKLIVVLTLLSSSSRSSSGASLTAA